MNDFLERIFKSSMAVICFQFENERIKMPTEFKLKSLAPGPPSGTILQLQGKLSSGTLSLLPLL